MSLKASLKQAGLQAIRASGAFGRAANSQARREKLLILCYHGISLRDEHEWAGHLFITAEQFAQRLQCLRDLDANVLPLGEAVERLRRRDLPPRSVVLTFDDGFYDFYAKAVPILRRFDMCCTLYLTTYYSGLPVPIVNLALDYVLWKSGRTSFSFPEQDVPETRVNTFWDRLELVKKLVAWMFERDLSTSGKDDFVRAIAARLGVDYDGLIRSRMLQIMTPDEAVQTSESGVDIQLHTHRHRTPMDRDLFRREIMDNRTRIREITGRDADHFCYPSGVHAQEYLPWLRELGVKTATTCERGFAQATDEPLLLPRLLDDSNMPLIQFEAFVSGFLS